MPRSSRSRLQLSDEEKKKRRREQKKLSMRRNRAKLDAASIEERRRKDRERYSRKKQDGLIKTIKDFTPREQRQIRKMWREKSKIRREKEKLKKRTEEMLNENTPTLSPSSSFSRAVSGRAVSARNRRLLKVKNEYLINRLYHVERQLAKYRMRLLRLKRKKRQSNIEKVSIKQKIHDFLLDDENSRLTAGKKDTITRRGVKKQIRLLNDTLFNLHKMFISKTDLFIAYETFRRHRPFWVIFPKVATRNTCLCSTHANNDYIVQALHQAKILPYSSASDVAKSLCCNNVLSVPCLERRCEQCSEKKVMYNVINTNDTIIYQRWITKNVTEIVKGQERQFKKTIKEKVKTTHQLLVNIFNTNLLAFLQHLANIINQFSAIRFIKQSLSPSEGLVHIDFSENYGYKYGAEIQSAHFGGSKGQLSLHTCVYYSTDSQPPMNNIKTTSICTASKNLRHDPVLICAHLKPVIEQIKLLSPDLKELHILSDGPTTQYRNKTMFHMIVNYLTKICSVERIIWHFSEAGHGKGAPDGIGGCIKRICDKAVANGKDITDINSFIECTKTYCKGIVVIPIDDEYVPEIQNIADENRVRPFKGTFKIHQISWSAMEPNILHARRLSCISCAAHTECPHFQIGKIRVQPVFDLIESQSLPGTPLSYSSRAAVLSPANFSPGTTSASTVTGPRTDTITPSPEPLLNYRQPSEPKKRCTFETVYSGDSNSLTPPKIFKYRPTFFDDQDESDENTPPNNLGQKTRSDFFDNSDESDENIF